MENAKSVIRENLRALRIEHGMTKEQFAKILGCSARTVANWEKGKGKIMISHILNLCLYFNVTADEIAGKKK